MPDDNSQSDFDEFIADITPDVMGVLQKKGFFARLEEEVFPTGSVGTSNCKHDFSNTQRLVTELGFDKAAFDDIVDVTRANGGFCDCEIVLNAAPESVIRAGYWKTQASKLVNGEK